VGGLLVLWDVDCTLLDARGVGRHLYGLAFRDLFGRDMPGMAPVDGRTDRAIIADTLALAGIADPQAHLGAFLAAMAARAPGMGRFAASRVRALPGAATAVAALAGTGGAVSVLTGNMRALAEVKLAAAGLRSQLDLAVGAYGDDHEVRAELVHRARQRAAAAYGTGFAGHATVLVGDTPLDIAAALATGARAVGVATGAVPATALASAGAHAVLPSLADTAAVVRAVTGGAVTA
jgi:phosphoglycolate phosphatase